MSAEDSADQIADAIKTLATHVKYLGVGNAATPMGAIEYLAIQIREGSLALQSLASAAGKIASAIEELAAASREGNDKLSEIANSIADAATELKEEAAR